MLELKTLKTLLPQKCRAWFVREGYILDLFTGLATSIEDFREWLENVKANSYPATAEISLPEWFKEYDIEYLDSDSLEIKRNKVLTKQYQLGALNKEYILFTVQKLGLTSIDIVEGVFDDENSCGYAECGYAECGNFFSFYGIYDTYFGYYIVVGSVNTESQRQQLFNTLNEIVRIVLEPIYNFHIAVIVGNRPYGAAFDGTYVWIGNLVSNNIMKIDSVANEVIATITVAEYPWGMTYGGGFLWVCSEVGDVVSKINTTTDTVVAEIAVNYAEEVIYAGGYVWASSYTDDVVKKIDPTSEAVVASITVGNSPTALAFDGTYVWVINDLDGTISKIDPSTNLVIDTVYIDWYLDSLVFDGTYLWVSGGYTDKLYKVDVSSDTVIATVNIGETPRNMLMVGSDLWVSLYDSNRISKVNISTLVVEENIAVGNNPYSLTYDGTHIWVSNFLDKTVSKIEI